MLVLIHPTRGNKQAGLRLSSTKSRERRACPHLSGIRNHAGGTSSICNEVTRKETMSPSVRYEESSRQDFVRLVCSRAIGGHILVRLVRGNMHAGLHTFGTKSRERRACPRLSGMRNQAGGISFVQYEVARNGSSSLPVWERDQAGGPLSV